MNEVPKGIAASAFFKDGSGDPIRFYIVPEGDNETVHLEDDGTILADLVANGNDIAQGTRRSLLDGILSETQAFWDEESLLIVSKTIHPSQVGEMALQFLSGLLRVRDLKFLQREIIRSTFKEDALLAVEHRYGKYARIAFDAPIGNDLSEYIPDIALWPMTTGLKTAVFIANSAVKFQEAELLYQEVQRLDLMNDVAVYALLEDLGKTRLIGERRFQRALNRGLPIGAFRQDEKASIERISHLSKMQ
jgi:hypothetical protein